MSDNPWANEADANPWQEQKPAPKFADPRAITMKARKVGFSGLDPDEQAYIRSAFPTSGPGRAGARFEDVAAQMDQLAGANRDGSVMGMIFPTASEVKAQQFAERAVGANQPGLENASTMARAWAGDIAGLPGKGFEATLGLLGSALLGAGGEKEAAKNEISAIPGEFANRSDFWGDPALGVGLVAPWVGAETIGGALASRGLPALGRAISAYPRTAGVVLGAAQGAGQAIGLNAAHELLSPLEPVRPAATDAAGVEERRVVEAGLPIGRWADPVQMGLGAGFGGALGYAGRELMQQGLMGTPGVRDFLEIASRVDRDVLPALTELIDQPGVLSKADILANAERWKREAQGVTGPTAERLSPLATAERKRLTSGGDEVFFDEAGVPFRVLPAQAQPFEAEALRKSGEVGGYGQALATGREPIPETMTREDIYKGILRAATAEHLAGKGELSKLSMPQIASMTRKMMETIPEMVPGSVFYAELPRYLAGFNNPAFDLYHSANRDAARELGRLGRKEVAPVYWENPSMTPEELEAMSGARAKYGRAALTDEWMDRANTARIEDRRNLIGKLSSLSEGLRWTGPLAARRLGRALLDIQPAVSDIAVTQGRGRK